MLQMRIVLGYALALVALTIVAYGVWAARYYSPARVYWRMRAKERRERERMSGTRQMGSNESDG